MPEFAEPLEQDCKKMVAEWLGRNTAKAPTFADIENMIHEAIWMGMTRGSHRAYTFLEERRLSKPK